MFSTLSLNLKKNLPAEAGAVPDFVSLPVLINPARVTVTGNRAWDTHTGEESERKHGRNFWRKCGFFPLENADYFKTDTYFKRRSVLINLLSQKKIWKEF